MRDFRKLLIWQKAMRICNDVYIFAATLPFEEKFGLRSQITRAAVSIPSNIAEGCSRKSEKEFCHYLEISMGSSFELETQILLCQSLKLGTIPIEDNLLENLTDLQKMLNSYYSKIITH